MAKDFKVKPNQEQEGINPLSQEEAETDEISGSTPATGKGYDLDEELSRVGLYQDKTERTDGTSTDEVDVAEELEENEEKQREK